MADLDKMYRSAKEIQNKLSGLQESLKNIVVIGKCENDLISLKMSCDGTVHETKISEELLNREKSDIENYVTQAINNAKETVNQRIKLETKKMMLENVSLESSLQDSSTSIETNKTDKPH